MLMLPALRQHPGLKNPRGNALAPLLIIVAALAASVAVFFIFTKKRIEEKAAASAVASAPSTPVATAPVAPKSTDPKPAAPPSPAPAPAPPAKPAFGFARPADLGEQLARSMSAPDLSEAAALIAAGDPAQQPAVLETLRKLKDLGYLPAKPDQVQIIGQTGSTLRLAIPLLNRDNSPSPHRLLIDVIKDDKMGWKVAGIALPKELAPALASAPAASPTTSTPGSAPAPGMKPAPMPLISVAEEPDSLTFASDFVTALLKPDYETARKHIDEERVSSIKLAALCIVFEDGQYSLQRNRPLMSTVATDTTSWIIAKVQSKLSSEGTEFGLEMEKLPQQGWRVIGLNLSKILEDNAKSSPQAGVPYTPLVSNPKGGESIALYFEYDSDILHPRAKRQLEIVAGILKASPASKLKIGGYTDAMGSDRYNLNLSNKRAAAVKQALLDFQGPLAQVETGGFGAADPLFPTVNPAGTDNPDGRSKNRRAEILLDF
ncbi:OmpA family protein [Phragmitibacter flavus]|uniref:OmpA family protein n=1 Tax=Phragmitibacter flavus TaxID=2576071 RepID=A0A5R8KE91_9BACT|nr:OmpA family protein [Phragmitibacter flavus]TLD70590.1 OmpA family protein [Phragmitibacter flavus]